MNCSAPGIGPSLSPGACLNSCPLSQWCYLTTHHLPTPSPLALILSQHQGLFQWVGSFHQVAKVLEFQLQSFQCMLGCVVLSHFSHVQPFATPWSVACQAPLSIGLSRQEYWSGLLCPSPGDLPNPDIKPRSPALKVDSWPSEPPGKSLPINIQG